MINDHPFGIKVLGGVWEGALVLVMYLGYLPSYTYTELLYQLFNGVYDNEVVGENTCYAWRDRAQAVEGKGTAVMSVKPFFDWLESGEQESDPEGISEPRQT